VKKETGTIWCKVRDLLFLEELAYLWRDVYTAEYRVPLAVGAILFGKIALRFTLTLLLLEFINALIHIFLQQVHSLHVHSTCMCHTHHNWLTLQTRTLES
jgi:hypothetical protein